MHIQVGLPPIITMVPKPNPRSAPSSPLSRLKTIYNDQQEILVKNRRNGRKNVQSNDEGN